MNKYIEIILKEAEKAYKKGEVPVGCLIVKKNKILSKSHNLVEKRNSVLNHAEILSIQKASKKNKNWRLNNCEMYVTLEPCNMCKEVIKQCRIKKIYYLVSQYKNSPENKNYEQCNYSDDINNKYKKMLKDFFKEIRK